MVDNAIRILRHIRKSQGRESSFTRNGYLKIEGYFDADYVGQMMQFTSTYCTYVGGFLVMWLCKKENAILRSSVKAERAMAHIVTKMI